VLKRKLAQHGYAKTWGHTLGLKRRDLAPQTSLVCCGEVMGMSGFLHAMQKTKQKTIKLSYLCHVHLEICTMDSKWI
jgi:hypothetical protein